MGETYARTVAGLLTGPVPGAQGTGRRQHHLDGQRREMGPHVYRALKAAVIGLSRSVALELAASCIRMNAICPGGIMTPIFLGGSN